MSRDLQRFMWGVLMLFGALVLAALIGVVALIMWLAE